MKKQIGIVIGIVLLLVVIVISLLFVKDVTQKNIDKCADLENPYDAYCLMELARTTDEYTYCEAIADVALKAICAGRLWEEKYCDYLELIEAEDEEIQSCWESLAKSTAKREHCFEIAYPERQECLQWFIDEAVKGDDLSHCIGSNECYTQVAIEKKDPEICDQIESRVWIEGKPYALRNQSGASDVCTARVAQGLEDINVCKHIENSLLEVQCEIGFTVQNVVSNKSCQDFRNTKLSKDSLGGCLMVDALFKNDSSLCQVPELKAKMYETINFDDVSKANTSYLEYTKNDVCFAIFSAMNNEIQECDNIQGSKLKHECKNAKTTRDICKKFDVFWEKLCSMLDRPENI